MSANQPEPSLREQVTKYVAALASSGNNFVIEGEQSPISDEVKEGYVNSLMDVFGIALNQAISKTMRAAEELAYEQQEAAVREAQQRGVAWAVGIVDDMHSNDVLNKSTGEGIVHRSYIAIKNTLRDRYKHETGIDPAPRYPIKVMLTHSQAGEGSK